MNIEFFGYFAAILTTLAFLPQLLKTIITKKAEDVSLITLIMFITGVASWIIYGYKISAIPIIIANVITLILNSLILIFKINYSQKNYNWKIKNNCNFKLYSLLLNKVSLLFKFHNSNIWKHRSAGYGLGVISMGQDIGKKASLAHLMKSLEY